MVPSSDLENKESSTGRSSSVAPAPAEGRVYDNFEELRKEKVSISGDQHRGGGVAYDKGRDYRAARF